jgi:hypothetical protein
VVTNVTIVTFVAYVTSGPMAAVVTHPTMATNVMVAIDILLKLQMLLWLRLLPWIHWLPRLRTFLGCYGYAVELNIFRPADTSVLFICGMSPPQGYTGQLVTIITTSVISQLTIFTHSTAYDISDERESGVNTSLTRCLTKVPDVTCRP